MTGGYDVIVLNLVLKRIYGFNDFNINFSYPCLLYTSTRKSISPAREYATLPSMIMWTPSTEKASLPLSLIHISSAGLHASLCVLLHEVLLMGVQVSVHFYAE